MIALHMDNSAVSEVSVPCHHRLENEAPETVDHSEPEN